MFEALTEKISRALNRLSSKGKLSEEDVDSALREIRLALLEADVNFNVAKQFTANIREKALSARVLESLTPSQQIVKIVNEELTSILGKESSRFDVSGRPPHIVMLVGLQGSGKTTTAAKLALNFKRSGQRTLLVAADTRRAAAVEQLVTLAKQLDIPVYNEDVRSSPGTICRNSLKLAREMAYTWVIIDTQGRLHVDEEMMNELADLKAEINPEEVLLVVDAMTGQDSIKIADEFNKSVGITGLVMTKMDGDARGGAALSIRFLTGVPIKFIGTGEKANALETFHPDRMASRILGMGDVLTLIEKAERTFDQQRARQLEKKIKRADMNLEDFLWQLNQIKKMGPINQLVEMVPGFSKLSTNMFDGTEESQLKRIEAIIQSMTLEERQSPNIINGSRRRRIAQGSGTTARDVNQLLNQFQKLQKMTKTMAKGKLPGNLMKLWR